ncbi:MAG: hypothetical protein L0Y79_11060 [Chlorobi bacterium]|nr:hypothetical protein [Chlorobiota bacterium]MCI0716432.1 hypothetical protein [Chlorobiota bacterium]
MKPNNIIKPKTKTKIKRRNFFYYLSAGALGIYALTKHPFKIFTSKVKASSSIKVKENPYAVKRDLKGSTNG